LNVPTKEEDDVVAAAAEVIVGAPVILFVCLVRRDRGHGVHHLLTAGRVSDLYACAHDSTLLIFSWWVQELAHESFPKEEANPRNGHIQRRVEVYSPERSIANCSECWALRYYVKGSLLVFHTEPTFRIF
jgi:hypothetical protein